MGAHFQISPGPVGGGPDNASYITRSQAAGEGSEVYHNAPESVEQAESWRETKIRFRSWAERVKVEEVARHGNRAGQARTHYRGLISYEETIETGAAKEDAREFLEEEFPKAQAVAVVHQDTDNTHVHIWISARKLNGKKVHIANGDLEEMHARMDEIYERRMEVPSQNAEKVRETKAFKRRAAAIKKMGIRKKELEEWAEANRPERATPPGPPVYREREERLRGQGLADGAEKRVERSQRREWEQAQDLISDAQNRVEESYERKQGRPEGAEPGAYRSDAAAQRGERPAGLGEQEAAGESEGADQHRAREESEGGRKRGREAGEKRERRGDVGDEGRAVSRDRSHVDDGDGGRGGAVAGSGGDSASSVGDDRGGVDGSSSSSRGGSGVGEGAGRVKREARRWVRVHLEARGGQVWTLKDKDLSTITDTGLLNRRQMIREREKKLEDLLQEKRRERAAPGSEGDLLRAKREALEEVLGKIREAKRQIERERRERPTGVEKSIRKALREASDCQRQKDRKGYLLRPQKQRLLEHLDRAKGLFEQMTEKRQEGYRARLSKRQTALRLDKVLEDALDEDRMSATEYAETRGNQEGEEADSGFGSSEDLERGKGKKQGSEDKSDDDKGNSPDRGRDRSRGRGR